MICYVVLHYFNDEVTRQCISHLKKIIDPTSQIIVVDNASPNHSGSVLQNEYKSDENVTIIINKNNAGFAVGNNMGYAYAKSSFGPEAIVVMNNDVFIEQNDFELKLKEHIKMDECDVIAPDIVSKSMQHQNPLRVSRLSSKSALTTIVFNDIKRVAFLWTPAWKSYLKYKARKNVIYKEKLITEAESVVPHGACLIFCNNYLHNESFAFPPITFMYCEEEILFDYINSHKYLLQFCYDLKVKHLEDSSTDASMPQKRDKLLFVYKYQAQSFRRLLECRIFSIDKVIARRMRNAYNSSKRL